MLVEIAQTIESNTVESIFFNMLEHLSTDNLNNYLGRISIEDSTNEKSKSILKSQSAIVQEVTTVTKEIMKGNIDKLLN